MRKLILIFFGIIFLTGCITEKKRLEICKTCTLKVTVKDSTGTPEIKDTPFDSLMWIKNHKGKDQEFSNCDSLLAALKRNKDTLVTKANGVKTTITRQGNGFKFNCATDSLNEIIKLLKREIKTPHFKIITNDVPARCDKEHLTKWDSFWIITGRVLSILLLIFAGALVWKYYKKFHLPL